MLNFDSLIDFLENHNHMLELIKTRARKVVIKGDSIDNVPKVKRIDKIDVGKLILIKIFKK